MLNKYQVLLKLHLSIIFFFIWMQPSYAVFVAPAKAPLPIIKLLFPTATKISSKQGEVPVRTVYHNHNILAYVFETNDIESIPAYSGKPVNVLVAISPKGKYIAAKVLEYHEPILLVGIPAIKLSEFTQQYVGLSIKDNLSIGESKNKDNVVIDGLSGATVTVMVMNESITRAAIKVAISLGLIDKSKSAGQSLASIKKDLFKNEDWQSLVHDGSIQQLYLNRKEVDTAFVGTLAEDDNKTEYSEEEIFSDIYFTLLDVPTIGRNLLGDDSYQRLVGSLKEGEHLLGVFGNGYSFKGSAYVRGGIFDRIQLHQRGKNISFRDVDQERIMDLYVKGAPKFSEMSAFKIKKSYEFNPGDDWQLSLLIRRQTGPIESVLTRFQADYKVLPQYLNIVPYVKEDEILSLTEQVWENNTVEVTLLLGLIFILFLVLFLQDILVRYPRFFNPFRHVFLIFTVVCIGWMWRGQLSIVNVFTFLQSLMTHFSWDLFLLDPVIFILWCAAAVTGLLWGRGVYCGWLCPFGALQELVNVFGRHIKLPQVEFPFAVHERLWAIKYLILLVLFGLSLDSLAVAEQFAEIEPFKTTFLLKFNRQWPFVVWAAFLILLNLVHRKAFCRYLCPLGAALSVSTNIKLFDWLKRRPECGTPCKTCAKECEIQAIEPSGAINTRECHYCLDCQVTYFDDTKCPPLKKRAYKKQHNKPQVIPTTTVV
ncbi:transcriptional regulator NosR [Shewanella surugensis]|uniref:NosR/NirI family protein n=1 Tax=Shewanella surugensis TaxID=212020 RepID=A0ABT0L7V0_9GAMM|nr:NosR/NirI family protein [Shewanella surugensis]MCL1123725.1 NosR/NirI family protein [Shewanella surugensis]